jgi:hypothetical protein
VQQNLPNKILFVENLPVEVTGKAVLSQRDGSCAFAHRCCPSASLAPSFPPPPRQAVVLAAYDYTVFAGTQGAINHKKQDRLFSLAAARSLPVVLFAEGGGGRPGDVDVSHSSASQLDVPTFATFARLRDRVPLVVACLSPPAAHGS